MSDEPFQKLHKLSFKNKELLDLENYGSCFSCFYASKISEIKRWTDCGQTAICPKCGIDSILPGDIGSDLLQEMYDRYFEFEL